MTYRDAPLKNSARNKKVESSSNEPDLFSIPVTPYRDAVIATTGHSGTSTSQARAIEERANGETTERQIAVISWLASSGFQGMTWKELDSISGTNHHGKTSGALSVLHQGGLIVRLAEVRNRCLVYVLPEYVNDRDISPISNIECVCGKSLKQSYNFCPNCGTAQDK